jgi:hypothetical protein
MEGWKSKGRHPSVSPEVARPFSETAVKYLEDEFRTRRLFEIVCTDQTSIRPFNFSNRLLPFVIGSFWADATYASDAPSASFVNEVFLMMLTHLFTGKVRFGDVVVNPVEVNFFNLQLHMTGVHGIGRQAILDSELEYESIARFFLRFRAKEMDKIFEELSRGRMSREFYEAFSVKAGELFVEQVTPNASDKKNGAAAYTILELLFQFVGAIQGRDPR